MNIANLSLNKLIFFFLFIFPVWVSRCVLRVTAWLNDFIPLCTFVQLYSSVDKIKEVPLQLMSKTEWFVALGTFLQHLSAVCQQMPDQSSSLTERLLALFTFVQLFFSVCQQMPGKIAGKWKWLEARCARAFAGHVIDLNCSPPLVVHDCRKYDH